MAQLQTWQPAIGSFLGLLAIFVAAAVGFRLNLKRDEHLRQQEVKSIAAALYAEVLTLQRQTARMANLVAKRYMDAGLGHRRGEFDRDFFELVPMPSAPVFGSLMGQIGKLPSGILLEIMNFHASYEEARYWLPRLEELPDRGFSYSVLSVLRPALRAIEGLQPALKQIEDLADISPAAVLPDIKAAKDAFEWEEDLWRETTGERDQ